MEKQLTGCIYIAQNKVNKKIYVGQTIDFEKRKKDHLRRNGNYYFHNALRKYGEEGFTWDIVFKCIVPITEDGLYNKTELDENEIYFIKYYESKAPSGYNLTGGGKGSIGFKHSDKTKEKLKLTSSDKKNYVLKNIETGEVFTGARIEFEDKHGFNIGGLFRTTKNILSVKNWILFDTNYEKKMQESYTSDKSNYYLKNVVTNEEFFGTQHNFKIKYGFNLQPLFGKFKSLSVKNWVLFDDNYLEKIKKIVLTDKNIYKIKNIKTNQLFEGIRSEFSQKFKIDISGFFGKNPNKVIKNWTLFNKNFNDIQRKYLRLNKIYTFKNIISNEEFIGSKYEFEKNYDFNITELFRKDKNINTIQNWAILNERFDGIQKTFLKYNQLYLFKNLKTNEEFKGTRNEFFKKYNFVLDDLLRTTKTSLFVKNWTIFDNNYQNKKEKWLNLNQIYTFFNVKTNEKFIGSRDKFKIKYRFNPKELFRKTRNIKVTKNWSLLNKNKN